MAELQKNSSSVITDKQQREKDEVFGNAGAELKEEEAVTSLAGSCAKKYSRVP